MPISPKLVGDLANAVAQLGPDIVKALKQDKEDWQARPSREKDAAVLTNGGGGKTRASNTRPHPPDPEYDIYKADRQRKESLPTAAQIYQAVIPSFEEGTRQVMEDGVKVRRRKPKLPWSTRRGSPKRSDAEIRRHAEVRRQAEIRGRPKCSADWANPPKKPK